MDNEERASTCCLWPWRRAQKTSKGETNGKAHMTGNGSNQEALQTPSSEPQVGRLVPCQNGDSVSQIPREPIAKFDDDSPIPGRISPTPQHEQSEQNESKDMATTQYRSDPINEAIRRLDHSMQLLYKINGLLCGTVKPENWTNESVSLESLTGSSLEEGIKRVQDITERVLSQQRDTQNNSNDNSLLKGSLVMTWGLFKNVTEKLTPGLKTVLQVVIRSNAVIHLFDER
jgi:hypothetical protein